MTKADHLSNKTAPKRILALDGGGIRGALSLGYLQRIEDVLRLQHGGSKNFRLSDYFDLIGVRARVLSLPPCLATGMSVAEIKSMYMDLGDKIFGKKYKWWKIFEIDDVIKAGYKSQPLEEQLQKVFGTDTTLASDKILTGLCIVAKRADTNSVWPSSTTPMVNIIIAPKAPTKIFCCGKPLGQALLRLLIFCRR